jgi:hypothetical protein
MKLFAKKDKESKPVVQEDISTSSDRSDFLPYHSHYNHNTILTRNGELLQILKIKSCSKKLFLLKFFKSFFLSF